MDERDVIGKLTEVLSSQGERIALMSQYSGGWEGWLQCELALGWPPGDVEREVPIWGDRRACDLWFPATQFCVELKCFGLNRAFKSSGAAQHISDIDSTYAAWTKDILLDVAKLRELHEGVRGISIVVIPTWLPPQALQVIKEQLRVSTFRWLEIARFYVALRLSWWL